jgi:hypothetical protein
MEPLSVVLRKESECVVCADRERDLMGENVVHAPEDDDNRRLCICDKPEAFPDHETRGEDRGKVEDLEEDLWREWGQFMRTPDAEN